MLPQLTGCRSFQPYEGRLRRAPGSTLHETRFEITTLAGDVVVLDGVWQDGRELRGSVVTKARSVILDGRRIPAKSEVVLPLGEVREIKSQRVTILGTVLAFGLLIVAGTWFYLGVTCEPGDFAPCR